jgi:hypothetical protein
MSLDINVVRCEALFASTVQSSHCPTVEQLRDAIMTTVRALGSLGCAACVAKEFGDHPETAVMRMRWAREQVATLTQRQLAGSLTAAPGAVPTSPSAA